MDKPHPLSSSSLTADLPDRLTMLTSHTLRRLTCCTLLLLLASPSAAHGGPPDVDGTDSQRVLVLEAVKTGILSSLGMDREPTPTQKASQEELRKIYQLYREQLREMRGNSSQMMGETRQSSVSTVLFPATVEPLKVLPKGDHPHSGQRMQWYRAVFHKNPDIQTELTLTRAELKISRQILDKPTSVQPRREVKVRVNKMKPMSSARAQVTSAVRGNVSSSEGVMLDISPEAERWTRIDGGQELVVDVGIVVSQKDAAKAKPNISLEVDLTQPEPERKKRQPRSNKEDECDEQGWCCRKSITVSFKDIGWTDWVVAPAEYTMHFCDGSCPHNYKPASMHTQVKSRMHQITKGETPRPCCVPAAYEPMVLMHYDSRGKLKLTPFNDLIVSKCLCA